MDEYSNPMITDNLTTAVGDQPGPLHIAHPYLDQQRMLMTTIVFPFGAVVVTFNDYPPWE